MTTANDILRVARGELGVRESPAGSNLTKYGAWYGMNGEPWCVMFVQWVFDRAGAGALLPVKTASCSALMTAAKKAGSWITSGYQPGDVVIYDFPGTAWRTDHCGIVEEAGANYIVAIEGNTGTGNDSNGGQVQRRTRSVEVILGAVRPPFGTDADAFIEGLTRQQLLRLLERIQWALSREPVSKALAPEWNQAEERGLTSGADPQSLCTRAQAAAMALRAVKK